MIDRIWGWRLERNETTIDEMNGLEEGLVRVRSGYIRTSISELQRPQRLHPDELHPEGTHPQTPYKDT